MLGIILQLQHLGKAVKIIELAKRGRLIQKAIAALVHVPFSLHAKRNDVLLGHALDLPHLKAKVIAELFAKVANLHGIAAAIIALEIPKDIPVLFLHGLIFVRPFDRRLGALHRCVFIMSLHVSE